MGPRTLLRMNDTKQTLSECPLGPFLLIWQGILIKLKLDNSFDKPAIVAAQIPGLTSTGRILAANSGLTRILSRVFLTGS